MVRSLHGLDPFFLLKMRAYNLTRMGSVGGKSVPRRHMR